MSLAIEAYRKSLHFLLVLIPLGFLYLGKWQSLLILAPITSIIVALDYLRRRHPQIKIIFAKIFGKILRPHELDGDKLCGASWVFLGACINFFIFKSQIAVTGFLILVISDALAALVGKAVPSQKFFEKSLSGSLAFAISALVILIGCGIYFESRAWFYIFGLFAIFCVTMIEARPSFLGIDDNFAIPLVFSFVMGMFDLMWNSSY